MKIGIRLIGILLTCLLSLQSSALYAEAFCALRDPQRGIYDLYPQATSYRSIVRVIDESTKQLVEKRLPPQTLHFSELGRHTLYVALAGEQPLGLVHVRSEESRWGLVEIAWALDLELQITDFRFQRCRSNKKKLLQAESFRSQLKGKNFTELLTLLKPGSSKIDPALISIPLGAENLAQVLLLCGLKTALITELAWQDDIQNIRLQQKAYLGFGTVGSIEVIDTPLTTNVVNKLAKALGGASLGTKQDQITVAKVFNPKGELLGSLYNNITNIDGHPTSLWWTISSDNKVSQVENANGWNNKQDKKVFQALIGRNFSQAEQCNNRTEMMALEAIIIANH